MGRKVLWSYSVKHKSEIKGLLKKQNRDPVQDNEVKIKKKQTVAAHTIVNSMLIKLTC